MDTFLFGFHKRTLDTLCSLPFVFHAEFPSLLLIIHIRILSSKNIGHQEKFMIPFRSPRSYQIIYTLHHILNEQTWDDWFISGAENYMVDFSNDYNIFMLRLVSWRLIQNNYIFPYDTMLRISARAIWEEKHFHTSTVLTVNLQEKQSDVRLIPPYDRIW